MSQTINLVTLVGNVGNEPKTNTLEGGVKVSTFSLATSTGGYTNKDGKEIPEVTQWHNIVAWRGLAEKCEKSVHKGDKLMILGTINYRNYEKDGIKHYVTDIVASDIVTPKKETTNAVPPITANDAPTPEMMPNVPHNDNDDLPF